MRQRPSLSILAMLMTMLLALSGCATDGSSDNGDSASDDGTETDAAVDDGTDDAPEDSSDDSEESDESGDDAAAGDGDIATDGFASLGDVSLSVWADAGDEATLARAEELFEAEYPNVDVEVTVRGFDDYVAIIANTMAGDDAPDVAQGNQGYGVDGLLVEADLITPLDDYAEVYGWTDRFAAGALDEYRWTDDGSQFGSGSLYGISPVSEFVGVFYNIDKLNELGIEPPQTLEEFEAVLDTAAAAGERPIQLGNAEGWPGTHVHGLVHAAFTPAEEIRSWVFGEDGATFASDTDVQAATRLQEWADTGYFGDDYNGVGNDDAVARFIDGDGVFFLAGTWNVGALAENMGDGVGFIPMPTGPSGVTGGTGSLGLGWHISSQTENPDLAAAFLALLHSEEFTSELAALGRVPAQEFSGGTEGLFADVVAANETIQADDGFTFYADWATDTMFDTLSSGVQELLAGESAPEQFAEGVQSDWSDFQSERG